MGGVALRQSARFGEMGGPDQYNGRGRRDGLAARADVLRDGADHRRAPEGYIQVQLGPPNGARKPARLSNGVSLMAKICCARTRSEVVVKREERQRHWHSQHERGEERSFWQTDLPKSTCRPKRC